MNVHLLEMPLDFGASRHGSDMGPSAIRLAGIREKLEHSDIPESFKGAPSVLIAAGLMAMAFTGFSGLI